MSAPKSTEAPSSAGRAYLVGAGPGDPGLLTARALELIAAADTILYDRLIPVEALAGARAEAELLYVGKEGGGEAIPQEQTEALLVARAKEGKRVVRLKGGDPFVFGRGGEEALALRAGGIAFEVVPGVTSGVAAPAYAGIPVTQRGMASAVALVTGHEDPQKEETALDWKALAAFPGTLVFYMGIRRLEHIARSLIAAGRAVDEPAAVVERGTMPGQRTVRATLQTIAARASEEDVRAPSITVVGQVAELGEQLAWRTRGPLSGRTVAVTRAREQASGLARRLRELGASVVEAPTIRVEPIAGAMPVRASPESATPAGVASVGAAPAGTTLDLERYDLICLTSANGVEALFARLAQANEGPRDARALANARVAAMGAGTAAALRAHGIVADVVAERFVAEELVVALADIPVHNALVARAREGREVLPEALRARGAEVDVMSLYETLAEPLPARTLEAARKADYITFTSSSTVRFFLQAAGRAAGESVSASALLSPATRVVAIGPVTSETLREYGIEPHVEAERHDIEGVVAALVRDNTVY